jgi:HlyD family secretion protein
MDRPRDESYKRKKRLRQILMVTGGAILVIALGVAVGRLEPAAPEVSRNEVWIESVQRGDMLRRVRGPGTLVPEEIRFVTTSTEGRVERVVLQPGVQVEADTVILELSNPELEQSFQDAKLALAAARARYRNREVELENQLLTQEAEVARIKAELEAARLQAEADQELFDDGLIPDINLKRSKIQHEQLQNRYKIEQQRYEKTETSIAAQLETQRAELEQARALYTLRQSQVEQLDVPAGISGVLQEVPVEPGQRVRPGDTLARVADPTTLKAELRIPETQAKDLVVGQKAEIDTRNGVVDGRLSRIDPAVREGTVLVDVEITGELPKGARPDLSVDGTIEIERLEDVLYVGRPAYGQPESTIQLFKLIDNGQRAVRVPVELGKSSVNTIEIRQGLEEGDEVILSDISRWDEENRLRIN